jgi:mono/diheme cytochrome c family protein
MLQNRFAHGLACMIIVLGACTMVAAAPAFAGGGGESDSRESSKGPRTRGGTRADYRILAANDLGMHCVDADFSVFSILPPYNVVNAQVLRLSSTGMPVVLDASSVALSYEAVTDASGSRNSTSLGGKTNFWQYAARVYGASLAPGQGLKGLYMPADAADLSQRSLSWSTGEGLFKAEGIPVLPIDDAGRVNRYPLLRLVATERSSGRSVANLDVVTPVSDETTCVNCHASGAAAASLTGIAWSTSSDLEVQSRENVLILHDAQEGTSLFASKPVLCATCHYSPALDLAGAGPSTEQSRHPLMSAVMHEFHADKMLSPSGALLPDGWLRQGETPPDAALQTCYQCHPGQSTKCLRGAMTDSVTCQNCHGGMTAVGGVARLAAGGSIDGSNDGGHRRPWLDLPRCQSCHTGDALNHVGSPDPSLMASDGLRLLVGFRPDDPAASPLLAANKRFAENDGRLFRFSKGHGGIACEGCHNSTHAIWPNPDATHNDNLASSRLQGHSGTLSECGACHGPGTLPLTLGGPHGMHNVADAKWTHEHKELAKQNLERCATCHGRDYRGTVLSRTAAARNWNVEHGPSGVPAGHVVGCYDCHNGPYDD